MRKTRPWGLDPGLLSPAKTQTDAVHEDIHWTELERQLIDSRPFQRLRAVKQLGTTNRVYPTAEHSRLTHCLGTLRVAQDIIDRIISARTGPHPISDLFYSWPEHEFVGRLAEAVVLARLAALMHDLTHIPFGHTIEDDLNILTSHDKNSARFELLWGRLPGPVRKQIDSGVTNFPRPDRYGTLNDELRAIILDKIDLPVDGESKAQAKRSNVQRSNYPFISDVVNNTICADLLDYLHRDHLFLGLPIGLGDRFMDNMYVAREGDDISYPERLVVRITRKAAPRTDTTTEILKHLRYRYEVTERALYHKTKVAYDAMLGKLLEMLADEYWAQRVLLDFPQLGEEDQRTDADWLNARVEDLIAAEEGQAPNPDHPRLVQYRNEVEERLEKLMMAFSDDGLLQYLIWHWTEDEDTPNSRVEAIVELAERVLFREGFKVVGHTVGEAAKREAEQKYGKWGDAASRRQLERYAARIAGVKDAWNVVIWLPSPSMRLKVAEVLVDDGQSVYKLGEHDPDAKQIVERHKMLWAMRLYAPPEIRDDRRKNEVLRACILERTGINLADERGNLARSLPALAAERVGDLIPLKTQRSDELAGLASAARSENWTFDDALREAWSAAHTSGWTDEPDPPDALFH